MNRDYMSDIASYTILVASAKRDAVEALARVQEYAKKLAEAADAATIALEGA